MTGQVGHKVATITLTLDVSRATAPLPVVLRWLLKMLGRAYGIKCRACTWR